jgi:hypothetical protein
MTAFELLRAPLDIDFRSCRGCGEIALELVRQSGKREMFQLLLSYGAVGEYHEMDHTIVDADAYEQSCWTAQDEEELRGLNAPLDNAETENSDIESDSEEYEDDDMSSEEDVE